MTASLLANQPQNRERVGAGNPVRIRDRARARSAPSPTLRALSAARTTDPAGFHFAPRAGTSRRSSRAPPAPRAEPSPRRTPPLRRRHVREGSSQASTPPGRTRTHERPAADHGGKLRPRRASSAGSEVPGKPLDLFTLPLLPPKVPLGDRLRGDRSALALLPEPGHRPTGTSLGGCDPWRTGARTHRTRHGTRRPG
jgi:hypothetical protein